MHCLAFVQYGFILTPLEEFALEIKHILHFRCYLVALRERSTEITVVTRVFACRSHRIFIAVQHLRNTTHRSQQHIRQFHTAQVFVLHHISDTRHVMVAEERQQFIHVRIEVIHRQRVIDAGQTVPPTFTVVLQGLTNSLFRWEIHHGRQVRIEAVEVLRAALPVRYSRSRTGPAFTNDIQFRILITDGFEPLAARLLLDIRIGIYAQTVQVGIFHPPDRPLLEIFQQVRVLQVHIRHRMVEPTAVTELTVKIRSVDIIVRREAVVRVRELIELVNPVGVG